MSPHSDYSKYYEYASLGAEITASMLGPILIGYFVIDYYFGTEPWGLVGGAVFGFISVFYSIYKIALKANQPRNDNTKSQ